MSPSSATPSTRRPSVLIVSFYFPPSGMGGVQRALKFARYLPEFGWDVTVIAPWTSLSHQSDPSLLTELPDSMRIERVWAFDPALVFRRRGFVGGAGSIREASSWARRVREWLRWPDDKILFTAAALRRARRLHNERPFDVVWTTSPPPSMHRVGLALAPRIPWIADFRDPWLARDDDWGPTHWHARWAQRLRQRIVQTADRVVAVSIPMAAALDRDGARHSTEVIYNGYDEADFVSAARPRSWNGPFTILCPGTLSPHSDPRPIFAAVCELRARCPELDLQIRHVGTALGLNPTAIAADYGLASIFTDLGYREHSASVDGLLEADIVAISVSELAGFATNIPGRLFEALRSQRPLILFGPRDGAVGTLVGRLPGCWVVPHADVEAGAEALRAVLRHPRGVPARTRESIAVFDRRAQTRHLASLFQSVIAARSREAWT
ncbi:MAG: glycosyltransferase [Candidatus Zixiibacteriota bacterium]